MQYKYFLATLTICVGFASSLLGTIPQTVMAPGSGPELRAILFESGRPSKDDGFSDSVWDVEGAEQGLMINLEIIKRFPNLKFQAFGTTDNSECTKEVCEELSLRRAQLMNDWLIKNGAPKSSLRDPVGLGDRAPLTDNKSEIERFFNRRAFLGVDEEEKKRASDASP